MIAKTVFEKTIGKFLHPLQPLLDDASVSEIMVNGHKNIFIERKGKIEKTDIQFSDSDALVIALRHISQFLNHTDGDDRLIVEGRLPDGSRFEALLPPLVEGGVHFTIRKFSKDVLTLEKLVEFGAFNSRVSEFLIDAVDVKKNIIVSGGTGSGKTSLLNALTGACDPKERLVVIEDAREIQPQVPHCLRLEAKGPNENGKGAIGIRDLFKATLRMRPDRIIVGEIRGGESIDLIQAMTSGHGGSMSTLHADSPREALSRLESMALMSSVDIPLVALRPQIALGVDLVVQISRFRCGGRGLQSIAKIDYDQINNSYELTEIVRRVFPSKSSGAMSESSLEFSPNERNG